MLVKIENDNIVTINSLPKRAIVGDYVIYNPTPAQLGYEELNVEEKEGYTWELVIEDNKVVVKYNEIPQPTEEELAEIARQEEEAKKLAEEQAEQARLQAIASREAQFNNNFFATSLGYIRRKATMKTGEVDNFLTDDLPLLAIALQNGAKPTVITYAKPDSFENDVDMTTLQTVKEVTAEFITECLEVKSKDFKGE